MKDALNEKYGSSGEAWRAVDLDGSNQLTWNEFCNMCRMVKFRGNVPGAWRHFDSDYSGFIHPRSPLRTSPVEGGRTRVSDIIR